MKLIEKYFQDLTDVQKNKLNCFENLVIEWNKKVNLISRKDIENIEERHILHSLSIAKIFSFANEKEILDVGTGGGFPGIPLAILFEKVYFTLIDSIGKKINIVNIFIKELQLNNVEAININLNKYDKKFDYIVSRAVCQFDEMVSFSKKNWKKTNGALIMLKGGDLENELKHYRDKCIIYSLKDYFKEEFFETKKVIVLPFF